MTDSQPSVGAGQQQQPQSQPQSQSVPPSSTAISPAERQASGLQDNSTASSGNAQGLSSISPNNTSDTAGSKESTRGDEGSSEDVKMEDNDDEQKPKAATDGVAQVAGADTSSGPHLELPRSDEAPGHPVLPPTKKATVLRDFLGKMDDYAPIIPDAVTAHYLSVAGLPPPGTGHNQTPPYLARLLALATQKFIADVATDAYQYSRIRASNTSSSSNPVGSINMSAAAGVTPAAASGAGGAGGETVAGGGGRKNAANVHLGVQRPGFGGGGQGGSQGKTVLTMEDLGMAVSEYGVSLKRGEFYR
ncbi:hypothetical protein KEM54_002988 [Ascosphaera aggregata]|nr:hypothetical protein KEM54_002988 [Ascosphaera aggregata]